MTGQHAGRRSEIEAALLDFQRAPGRHTLNLRQPALLFASIREVLQYAAERSPADGPSRPPSDVVQAARFFVRSALLKPGADHYALLGLTREADASAIKERYRAMMRLTHPDFATSTGGAHWPADAATRINQAYEVLSSPDRRRTYDEAAQPSPQQAAPREAAASRPPNPAQVQRHGDSRLLLRHLATGFGALAAIALVALWASTASGERDSLVQRATTRVVADKLPALFGQSQVEQKPAAEDGLQAAIIRALPAILAAPVREPPAAAPASAAPAPALATASQRADVHEEAVVALAPTVAPAPAPALAPAVVPAPAIAAAPSASTPTPPPAAPAVSRQTLPPPSRVVAAGPSMADVHPLVTRLLQDIESGWGDNLIASLDFGVQRSADAQAIARQLDALCDGVRPVKVSKVDLKGEPHEGKLVLIGQVILQVRDPSTPTRQFALQAEFSQQGGAPVLTRLAPVSLQ